MDTPQFCLWVQSLWECAPYIYQWYSVYNIWSAFTALWVLIAAYQLLNENLKFRIAFRKKWARLFILFITLSIIFVFIADILPVIGWEALPLLWYTLFWEILSAFIFTIWILWIVFISNKKITNISNSDLDKLIQLTIIYLAKWSKWAAVIANQINDFFPSIYNLLIQKNEDAQNLIMLFSDTYLLRSISENPEILMKIFRTYIWPINNKKSVLYKKSQDYWFQKLLKDNYLIRYIWLNDFFARIFIYDVFSYVMSDCIYTNNIDLDLKKLSSNKYLFQYFIKDSLREHILLQIYIGTILTYIQPNFLVPRIDDKLFLRNLFNEALSNNDSIITRELHWKNFSKINYGSWIFLGEILHNPELILWYNLLGWFDQYLLLWEASEIYDANYLLLWEKVLDDSIFLPDIRVWNTVFTESIRAWFGVIASIIAKQSNMEQINKCLSWFSRFRILIWDNNDRLLLVFHDGNIPDPIIDSSGTVEYAYYYRPHNNTNFLDAIAFGIEAILEQIAMKIKTDQTDEHWMTRHICMEMTERYENDEILSAIYDRLHIIFDQRIKKNLFGWYPMFLPLFFHAYGHQIFTEFESDNSSVNNNAFYKKIMLHIKEKLPRIADWYIWWAQEQTSEFSIEKSKKILKDILPSNMEYIRDSNTLIYYYSEREHSVSIPLNSIE